ncbi:basic-leucine zipper transcription factor [Cavenderia fasciculata]|uniref:Basic-leucine zipper transcription factor n=1 Tax=Cavenderia fasciculata TaxID=261658 RepID=F4QCN7_CACFS|nr:basic-leucine zipper transcription factor [Cavenderia fasciculata]EGG13619.1 basic-leucine zipper transcription factor [Cavenderia fasciculata]|eukprot:XP_004350323.1 basic-leucine zipper transcription factor [Cavenderia fasciculata]
MTREEQEDIQVRLPTTTTKIASTKKNLKIQQQQQQQQQPQQSTDKMTGGVEIATSQHTHPHGHHSHSHSHHHGGGYQDWYHSNGGVAYSNHGAGSYNIQHGEHSGSSIPYNTPTVIGFDIQQPLPPIPGAANQHVGGHHPSHSSHHHNIHHHHHQSSSPVEIAGAYMINMPPSSSDYPSAQQVQYEMSYAQPFSDPHSPISAGQHYSSPDQANSYYNQSTPASPKDYQGHGGYQPSSGYSPYSDEHKLQIHPTSTTSTSTNTANITQSGISPSYEGSDSSNDDLDCKEPNKKRVRETIDISGQSILTKDQVLQLSSREIEEYVYRLKQTHILTPAQEKDLKKFRRLIKNREYASQSRDRKKLYVNQVVDQLEKSELDSRQLKSQLLAAQAEVRELKKQLEMVNQTIHNNPSLLEIFGKFFTFGGSSSTVAPTQDKTTTTTTTTTSSESGTTKKASSVALFVFFCIFTFTFLLPVQPPTISTTITKGKTFVGPRSLLQDDIPIQIEVSGGEKGISYWTQTKNWISNLFPSSSPTITSSTYSTKLVEELEQSNHQQQQQQQEEEDQQVPLQVEEVEEEVEDTFLISNSPIVY